MPAPRSFTYNKDIDVAVGVAMDGGLLTLVLKNADQGAIMAVGASTGATRNGLSGLKNRMMVIADHRIIYGGDLGVFLQTLAAIIEDPKIYPCDSSVETSRS